MRVNIGVDVGGTKIAAGAITQDGRILSQWREATPTASEKIPEVIASAVVHLQKELDCTAEVEAVGISAAGFISPDRSSVVFAPNINWRNEPLAEKVAQATGLPVVLENDANAAAWGEYRFGAAAGHTSVAVITVGTGIGGGLIIDGELVRGAHGFGAEIGHIILKPNGDPCGCGLHGCWEAQASGTALVRLARNLHAEGKAARIAELAGSSPIDGKDITRAAEEGDSAALQCFEEIGRWTGVGMAALSAVFDPSIFVISGGVSETGDLLLDPIRRSFRESLTAASHRPLPHITAATLGNLAGLIGAADLARQ